MIITNCCCAVLLFCVFRGGGRHGFEFGQRPRQGIVWIFWSQGSLLTRLVNIDYLLTPLLIYLPYLYAPLFESFGAKVHHIWHVPFSFLLYPTHSTNVHPTRFYFLSASFVILRRLLAQCLVGRTYWLWAKRQGPAKSTKHGKRMSKWWICEIYR